MGGSAASGGGLGGDHSVRNDVSFGGSEVVLTRRESLSSGMVDAERSESDLDVHHQQVKGHLRQESKLQLQQLQQQRPLPLNSLGNPHHQANKRHNPRRPTPRPDSPGNQGRAVDPPSQQQQQLDQPPLAQVQDLDWSWLARADEQSGSGRLEGTGDSVNRISPPFPPVSELSSGAGKGVVGGAVNGSHPGILPPTPAFLLVGDAPVS